MELSQEYGMRNGSGVLFLQTDTAGRFLRSSRPGSSPEICCTRAKSFCDRDHFRKALEKVSKIVMLFNYTAHATNANTDNNWLAEPNNGQISA